MTTTISIVNQKGGVGKTTTTVNLASALTLLGKKVLIIDLDPQGHASEHLGANRMEEKYNILNLLQDKTSKPENFYKYNSKLFVLASNIKLGSFNQNTDPDSKVQMQRIIEGVKSDFDFILIDCQPSLSLLTLNALAASDKVLLPVQSEFLALDGLSQLILTFKQVKQMLNPNLSILGIVLTMFDRRNRLSREVQKELEINFEKDLFDTVIPRSVKMAEAPSFGKTGIDYAPSSEASLAYIRLAKELVKKLGNN